MNEFNIRKKINQGLTYQNKFLSHICYTFSYKQKEEKKSNNIIK